MFRCKVFEPTLTGISYRIFIEGLRSPVTKAAYTFALQKYMKCLKIDDNNNPDSLLEYKDNPKFIQNQIIDYLIYLKNPPISLRYATRSEENRLKLQIQELTEKTQDNEYIIKAKLQEKDEQIQSLMKNQDRFEQLIQSLIDSGQLKPTIKT
jgi:hypothetical protein